MPLTDTDRRLGGDEDAELLARDLTQECAAVVHPTQPYRAVHRDGVGPRGICRVRSECARRGQPCYLGHEPIPGSTGRRHAHTEGSVDLLQLDYGPDAWQLRRRQELHAVKRGWRACHRVSTNWLSRQPYRRDKGETDLVPHSQSCDLVS